MRAMEAIERFMATTYPLELAEDWDNVGLLLGDANKTIGKVMTCLTITPEVVAEAVSKEVDLIISHHPLPFVPQKTITSKTASGQLIVDLLRSDIAVYSPHTAHDNAIGGINDQLAQRLRLNNVEPLHLSSGRFGFLSEPSSLEELALLVKDMLGVPQVQVVDSRKNAAENGGVTLIRSLAVACGAAGEFLEYAVEKGADALLLGETRFHTYLEAKARGVSLLMPGHFASEFFAMETLARKLSEAYPDLECRLSESEHDPVVLV